MNTKLEVGPPMETLEDVEKEHHSYDLEPVLHIILVNVLIIRISGREVGKNKLVLFPDDRLF